MQDHEPSAQNDVATKGKNGEKTPAGRARARVREEEPGSTAVSSAEIEAVATAIENGTPARNETIRSIIADYPRVRRLLVANAIRCLRASRTYYNSARKAHVTEPEYQLRLRALEFLADRLDGKPPQQVMNLNANVDASGSSVAHEFRASPTLVEAMERYLAKMKAQLASASVGEGGVNATPPRPS